MRKFVFCVVASGAVISIVIIDKAMTSPQQRAELTAVSIKTRAPGPRSARPCRWPTAWCRSR
jgi:hypothetical protein